MNPEYPQYENGRTWPTTHNDSHPNSSHQYHAHWTSQGGSSAPSGYPGYPSQGIQSHLQSPPGTYDPNNRHPNYSYSITSNPPTTHNSLNSRYNDAVNQSNIPPSTSIGQSSSQGINSNVSDVQQPYYHGNPYSQPSMNYQYDPSNQASGQHSHHCSHGHDRHDRPTSFLHKLARLAIRSARKGIDYIQGEVTNYQTQSQTQTQSYPMTSSSVPPSRPNHNSDHDGEDDIASAPSSRPNNNSGHGENTTTASASTSRPNKMHNHEGKGRPTTGKPGKNNDDGGDGCCCCDCGGCDGCGDCDC